MNAICLVVDRLHAGYLGAGGNTWIETPAFDRLAAESFLFDQALVDTPGLEALYGSYWQGRHALLWRNAEDCPTLPGLLREAGVNTTLLTDERLLREHALAVEFDDVAAIDPPWRAGMAPDGQFEQTHLARCFVEIVDRLQRGRRPFLLWCHLGSLGAVWDAPAEFRHRYWLEGDPPPSQSADVPDRLLAEDHDPDEVLGFSQAYAGQVSLLDTCLGGSAGPGGASGGQGNAVGADRGPRISAGRAPPAGALRRGPLLGAGPRAAGAAIPRSPGRGRPQPGPGRARRRVGHAPGCLGAGRGRPPNHGYPLAHGHPVANGHYAAAMAPPASRRPCAIGC